MKHTRRTGPFYWSFSHVQNFLFLLYYHCEWRNLIIIMVLMVVLVHPIIFLRLWRACPKEIRIEIVSSRTSSYQSSEQSVPCNVDIDSVRFNYCLSNWKEIRTNCDFKGRRHESVGTTRVLPFHHDCRLWKVLSVFWPVFTHSRRLVYQEGLVFEVKVMWMDVSLCECMLCGEYSFMN